MIMHFKKLNICIVIKNSDNFFKSGDFIFSKDEISMIDCSKIENLEVKNYIKKW